MDVHVEAREEGRWVPLVRISHLLDFEPALDGIWERRFSNKSFISLRRFRSAILWLTRRAGVLLYGMLPSVERASSACGVLI